MSSSGGDTDHRQHTGQRDGNKVSSQNNGSSTNEHSPRQNTMLGKAKRFWAKTGITTPVAKLMFKGAIAPTIALAAFQSDVWSTEFTTLGYLIAVMTQLSIVIQPRAKFVQTMMVQTLLICLAAAIAMLACYCAVVARADTGIPGTGGAGTSGSAAQNAQTAPYDSNASTIAGVFLFVEIYAISAMRAKLPHYTIPCIMFAIFANVSMTYASQFSTVAQAESFVKRLISAFLTGFGIATVVSLLIFPVTSRESLFNDMRAFIGGLQGCLGANMTYLNSLEQTDMFAAQKTNTRGTSKPRRSPEAEELNANMKAVSAIHAKCATNLTFAKRELALGRLGGDDLQAIFKLLRELTIPIVGLSTLSDIFERISEESGWDRSQSFAAANIAAATTEAEKSRIESINQWHELIRLLQEPFADLTEVIDAGLQHVVITLQLVQAPAQKRSNDDREAIGDSPPKPGDRTFAAYLDRKSEEFNKSKQLMLRGWCRLHGIELPDNYFTNPNPPNIEMPSSMHGQSSPERVRVRRQLMVFLYVESMLYICSKRTYKIVQYVDGLRDSGKLSRARIVFPGYKRLRKWILRSLKHQDVDQDEHFADTFAVSLGEAYNKSKDPEHLPPQNLWESWTDIFRHFARFFGSPASVFGFRSAVATLSIAVVSLLQDSQVFATQERLFWAQIMTSIAMAPSAGQSLRTFVLRTLGTLASMVLAIAGWYIVDGKTAGVLVIYFLLQLPGLYIMVKRPTILPIGLIGTITLTLILGYELQVRKIGVVVATSNGQLYHPIYILAPIRLLTVVVGLFVAWIFTVFPHPITESSQLRENTAKSIHLLASYYSTVNETVKTRLKGGHEADENLKGSPAQKLGKTRLAIFSKSNMLLSGMRSQSALVKYDIPIGGRFPKAKYDALIERVQSLLSFVSLVSVASSAFGAVPSKEDAESQYVWVRHLREILPSSNVTSESVTTLLSLLSASLGNSQPLPPFLRTPAPYGLAEKLDAMDSELLSISHIAEHGYASFAVIQVGVTCMIDDLKDLLEEIKDLVGELDYSYHVSDRSAREEDWYKHD